MPEKTRSSTFMVRRTAGANRSGGRNRSCSPTPTTHGRPARRARSCAGNAAGARGVRQQVAIRAIHSTPASGGSTPGATNNRSIARVLPAVGRSSDTAEAAANVASTPETDETAG